MKDLENLMTEEEFLAWYDSASPEEIAQFEQWQDNIPKWAEQAYTKAGVVGKHIGSKDDPWELSAIYDAIVSHNASTISKKKTHPLRERFKEIAAKEKAIDPRGYIKRASRLEEFKSISPDTLKDWLK